MNAVSYGEAWRHYREIYENRKVWARKPVLRRAYAELYREICENIEPSLPGIKVELGRYGQYQRSPSGMHYDGPISQPLA